MNRFSVIRHWTILLFPLIFFYWPSLILSITIFNHVLIYQSLFSIRNSLNLLLNSISIHDVFILSCVDLPTTIVNLELAIFPGFDFWLSSDLLSVVLTYPIIFFIFLYSQCRLWFWSWQLIHIVLTYQLSFFYFTIVQIWLNVVWVFKSQFFSSLLRWVST